MRDRDGGDGREIVLTYSHDCKTFMDEDTLLPDEATGPIRSSVAQTL